MEDNHYDNNTDDYYDDDDSDTTIMDLSDICDKSDDIEEENVLCILMYVIYIMVQIVKDSHYM